MISFPKVTHAMLNVKGGVCLERTGGSQKSPGIGGTEMCRHGSPKIRTEIQECREWDELAVFEELAGTQC